MCGLENRSEEVIQNTAQKRKKMGNNSSLGDKGDTRRRTNIPLNGDSKRE